MSIITPGGPFNVMGAVVTANYFGLLRLQPAMGRFFLPDEDAVPGRNPVAILSYDVWRTRFGADGGILGKAVRINGTAFTVVGIAPEGFHGVLLGLEPNGVWIPSAMFSIGYRYCNGLARGCNVVGLLGRLNDGVSVQDAQAEMSVLTGQLQSTLTNADSRDWSVEIRPALGIRIDEQQRDAPIVRLLAGAAALVLSIASANVAGLMLARGLRRRKGIAIRLALGASRGRVIRLLLVESVLLAVVGGAAGFLVSIWATNVLRGYFGQAGRRTRSIFPWTCGSCWRLRQSRPDRRRDRHLTGASVTARHGGRDQRESARRAAAAARGRSSFKWRCRSCCSAAAVCSSAASSSCIAGRA